MYNPVEIAEITEKTVCENNRRKYYRFMPARFYGGISTADCVGCCLRCVFCWSWNVVAGPEEHGNFYTPEEVARRLINIARKKKLNQMRISGNEPTIFREQLLPDIHVKASHLTLLRISIFDKLSGLRR